MGNDYASQQQQTPLDQKVTAMRIVTMPKETNPYGTIFGGIILSYIDQAGFVEARRHGDLDWVTAAIGKVVFHAPVHVGDIVTFITCTTRFGRTSIDVQVEVEAERFRTHEVVHVTSASLTMVGMRDGQPFPFRECPSSCPVDKADS
ncbi:MAG: hotdog domain-containing protein [Phycisphaerales bacterium]